MKFWFLNSMFMLLAVGYAACLAPGETSHTFGATGPDQRQVELVKLDSPAYQCDYCLGFDGSACETPAKEVGASDKESGKDAAKGTDTDASTAKDGAKIEPVAATTDKPTYLIYFTATWCGPCQVQKPIINEIKDAGKHKVYIVDIDNDPTTAASWGVNTVPTVATVVKGKVTYRGVGAGHTRAFLESKLEAK